MLHDCRCELGGIALGTDKRTDSAIVAIAGGARVRVLDLHTGTMLRTMPFDQARARCVSLGADGTFVLSGHFDQLVRLTYLSAGCTATSYGGSARAVQVVKAIHLAAKKAAAGQSPSSASNSRQTAAFSPSPRSNTL